MYKRKYKTGLPPSKGKKWYNNGEIESYGFEIPEGFVEGRLPRNGEWILNMKAAAQRWLLQGGNKHLTGKTPWNKGKKIGPNYKLRRPIRNKETGVVYDSVMECCEKEGINRHRIAEGRRNGKYEYAGKYTDK